MGPPGVGWGLGGSLSVFVRFEMAIDIGKVVMFGAIGYGAYWLYSNYVATPTVAAAHSCGLRCR